MVLFFIYVVLIPDFGNQLFLFLSVIKPYYIRTLPLASCHLFLSKKVVKEYVQKKLRFINTLY